MKAGAFVLRAFLGLAEHLAGAGEIEAASGQRPERPPQKMCAVDVDVSGWRTRRRRVADETSGPPGGSTRSAGPGRPPGGCWRSFRRSGVELQAGRIPPAGTAVVRILQGHPPYDTMT